MQRVLFAVVHGDGGCHRRGVERLHLVGVEAVFLQPQHKVEHVFVGCAGVGGDEIRDQVLFLACLFGVFLEELFEDDALFMFGDGDELIFLLR